jgi:polyhydroxyalkanoate synthase
MAMIRSAIPGARSQRAPRTRRAAGTRPLARLATRVRAANPPPADPLVERATQNTLAANPLIGVRGEDVLAAARTLLAQLARQPRTLLAQARDWIGELAAVARGRSAACAPADDRRFADPAWSTNPWFRRLLQAYLSLGRTLERSVDDARLDRLSRARAHFVVAQLLDAIAPTNFIVTNPAALRKLRATRGASALRGLANLVEDLAAGRGLPRQVDERPFTVGRNLAATVGTVVHREPMLELIQYGATTTEVHERPLLIVPPQINKYYAFDLAPGKSVVEWALGSGLQTFVVSWRNPTREHADWGLDAYVAAVERAVDAVREITGAADVNLWGACSGGITLSAFLGYLAATRQRKVHTATIAVCVLDTAVARDTTAGLFVTPATIAAARAASGARGVLEGGELARMFAWMRPNDLIWNYVVNNYLLGNEPPAYDILYWNNDSTRLPARLHADFLALYESNPFLRRGALKVRGRRIDVGRTGLETYVVGGLTDHITPWQGVYQTARLYGGERSTFVLSNGGHIQSLINPPGSARSWFMSGLAADAQPEAWRARQGKTEGSWWPHWRGWIRARSGAMRPAPATPGSAAHAVLGQAPGSYALER